MHIEGIDHIGIASKDPARTRWFFSTALQLGVLAEESVPTQLVDTVTWSSAHGQKSQGLLPHLELLIPSSPDSVVSGAQPCTSNKRTAAQRRASHQQHPSSWYRRQPYCLHSPAFHWRFAGRTVRK